MSKLARTLHTWFLKDLIARAFLCAVILASMALAIITYSALTNSPEMQREARQIMTYNCKALGREISLEGFLSKSNKELALAEYQKECSDMP